VDDDLRLYIDLRGQIRGPISGDDAREALRDGKLPPEARLRFEGTECWASPRAFAALARVPGASRASLPGAPDTARAELPPELAAVPASLRDLLLFWVAEGPRVLGPVPGAEVRRQVEAGQLQRSAASLVDSGVWFPASLLAPAPASARGASARDPSGPATARTIYLGAAADAAPSSRATQWVRCAVCLESIAAGASVCPECGELPVPAGPASIPDDAPNASWLAMHWRPLVTLGVMTSIVCTGVALRHLAPGRFLPPRLASKAAASAHAPVACAPGCWTGEACHEGRCTWEPPNDVTHVAKPPKEPTVGGPFALPKDVSDALPLDGDRFAVSLLAGIEVRSARTGGVLSLVTDAPQSRRLFRVGSVVYGTAPQRIYVIDPASTRLLKTIETGSPVGEVTVGASGRRALASLPAAHAVAVLATEYHAEIDRIQFGDDAVGPMGTDDTGKRALTTTGQIPLAGLRDANPSGAAYAFDPSRLASAQDRVRASMVGNPVSVLMTPDGQQSFVVLRGEDALVPLTWLPSGAVRQEARIPTCREPEQIELVRRGRLGVVRCNEGKAIEVFDLRKREMIRHVPFNARVADMAVAPDGRQAIVALPADGAGFVGLVDLETFAVKVLPVTAEPTRVRLSPDGSTALVLSERAKVAWVIR
jgi:hypothetical protein